MLTGLATIISSCFVVGFYIGNPDMRSGWRQMVVMLSVCDMLQGIFYTFFGIAGSPGVGSTACTAFGTLGMWSAAASFLWTACLTAYVAGYLAHGIPSKALGTSKNLEKGCTVVKVQGSGIFALQMRWDC